jgi:hypothetical protein
MTSELSTHLSEEAIDDVLIGMNSAHADAHLAGCLECRDQLEEFRTEVQWFNQASLAWSEARSATIPRPAARLKVRPAIVALAGWALVAVVLLAIGLSVWNHSDEWNDRPSAQHAAAPAAVATPAPQDSEEQIAQDNDLLQSIDAALNAVEESPVREYRLSHRPHSHPKARPELRNR